MKAAARSFLAGAPPSRIRRDMAKSRAGAPEILFFPSARAWRAWLGEHHDSAREAWVGFYRKDSGRAGLTYPEALDEALCFGWIDGVRRKIDDLSYTNRFTPRKARSYWSDVNTRRANELIALGRMAPAGRAAFGARDTARTARYSFERATAAFDAALLARFRRHRRAWAFFEAQPPSYRKTATWFVVSAKQEATRLRRLETLIARCAAGERLM